MPLALTPLYSLRALTLYAAITASSALFGPPRITVHQVTDPASAPPGAVLLIDGQHHSDMELLTITARAEGLRNGQRVQQSLTLNNMGGGHYSVTRQWQTGTPWVLVFTAEQGEHASHGIAEAIVQVDAGGKIVSIEHPVAGWLDRSNEPKRVSAREIGETLARLAAKP